MVHLPGWTLSRTGVPEAEGDIGFSIPEIAGFTVKSSPGFLRTSVRIPGARRPEAAMPPLSFDSRKDDNLKIDPDTKARRLTLNHFHCRFQQTFPYVCKLILNISSGARLLEETLNRLTGKPSSSISRNPSNGCTESL